MIGFKQNDRWRAARWALGIGIALAAGCQPDAGTDPAQPIPSLASAPILITNARIYTMDAGDTLIASGAMAFSADGEILGIGDSEPMANAFPAADLVDLEGRTVLPGLIDGRGEPLRRWVLPSLAGGLADCADINQDGRSELLFASLPRIRAEGQSKKLWSVSVGQKPGELAAAADGVRSRAQADPEIPDAAQRSCRPSARRRGTRRRARRGLRTRRRQEQQGGLRCESCGRREMHGVLSVTRPDRPRNWRCRGRLSALRGDRGADRRDFCPVQARPRRYARVGQCRRARQLARISHRFDS